MIRHTPSASPTDTLFPYTPLFLSMPVLDGDGGVAGLGGQRCGRVDGQGGRRHGHDVPEPVVVRRVGHADPAVVGEALGDPVAGAARRSEEHTSELQSLMRISYAVFCLKKKKY